MAIITLDKVSFSCEEVLAKEKEKRKGKKLPEAMEKGAYAAFDKALRLIELKALIETFPIRDISGEFVEIETERGRERFHVGPRVAGLLMPAKEIAAALCTASGRVADKIHQYGAEGENILMYYLDIFAVKALDELAAKVSAHVEERANERGWGVGPLMQPGSAEGWAVTGQKTLFALCQGERLGLSINESSMLAPHISDSLIIGVGPDYANKRVGSLCPECPRYAVCLWRKENVAE